MNLRDCIICYLHNCKQSNDKKINGAIYVQLV